MADVALTRHSDPKSIISFGNSAISEYSSVPNRRVGQKNVQVGKFIENIKRAGRNRREGGKFSGKSIIVQVILIFETVKVIVKFILTCLLSYLSQI